MSALITQKELADVLLALLNKMLREQKLGITLSKEEKDALVNQVAQKIFSVRKDLTNDNLKDMSFQKLFRAALLSQHLENTSPDKKLHFDFAKLFDKNLMLKLDPKKMNELEKKLELTFKLLLTKLNELQPNSKLSEKQINEHAKKLANDFLDKLKPEGTSLLDCLILMESLLDKAMREIFGGMVPGVSGSIPSIVCRITGNLFGIADQQGGNELSFSFMDESNRYDGKPDYAGTENENLQRLISLEGSEIDSILTNRGETLYPSHNPFKTTLTPPGGGTTAD